MKSQFTPESVSNLSEDELRIEVARKMWPDGPYAIIGNNIIISGEYRAFPDPLSPEGAFRLMVENKIDVSFEKNSDYVMAESFRMWVGSVSHPATLECTARAICEAFVLMEKT